MTAPDDSEKPDISSKIATGKEYVKNLFRTKYIWIVIAVMIMFPSIYHTTVFWGAQNDGKPIKALHALENLDNGLAGLFLGEYLDEKIANHTGKISEENLQSIRDQLPDSLDASYAEFELAELSMERGNYKDAVKQYKRYLNSGLPRDIDIAYYNLSACFEHLGEYEESSRMLTVLIETQQNSKLLEESGLKLGELYQFKLNRPALAKEVYTRTLNQYPSGRFSPDILTNLSLL